jgi:type IV pilus assembly protein PilC
MRFTYTAEKDGVEYTGILDVKDRFGVYQKVREEGGRLISVASVENSIWTRLKTKLDEISTVPGNDIVIFARTLSAMLVAGLPLSRALGISERQTKNGRLKATIGQLLEGVKTGKSFNEVLSGFPSLFQPLFIAMVKAGEESGSLPQALTLVSEQLDRNERLKKQIRGALMYPGVILCVMLGVAYLLLTEVVPTLKTTFEEMDVELPTTTKVFIGASDFLQNNLLLSFGIVAGVFAGIYALHASAFGKRVWHNFVLIMPVLGGMVTEINAARASRTLASLVSAGVDVVRALAITGDVVQNVRFKDALMSASEVVVKGDPLSAAFSPGKTVFPDLFGEMIAVGEETGSMSDMLTKIASFYEEEVEQKMKNISSIIEPVLMVVIGGAVGLFAIAIISPIYSLSDAIQ